MIFIANFKMMLTAHQTITHFKKNCVEYQKLAQQAEIIVCLTSTSLVSMTSIIESSVHLGAQTCSAHSLGAYTGDVSAQDLAECNVTYCLVGHSERRALCGETDEQVIAKVQALRRHNITPVVCIGETITQYTAGITQEVLANQLAGVLQEYAAPNLNEALLIAYEPVWAIGTGKIPTSAELATTFNFLHNFVQSTCPNLSFKLLYGGSVSSKNIQTFDQIEHLSGFLVGKASLDFQEFKKIVDYFHCPPSL